VDFLWANNLYTLNSNLPFTFHDSNIDSDKFDKHRGNELKETRVKQTGVKKDRS
jgi:hypothetical protein